MQLPGPVEARRFTFPYQASATDLRYRLQHSSDLGIWNNAFELDLRNGTKMQVPGISGTADANAQGVTVYVTDPALFSGTMFGRLSVDLP